MPTLTSLAATGGRALTRLASATALLAGLAGIPCALTTQIGWPLPRTWPALHTTEDIERLLTTPVTDVMVINLLALALWILWATFTLSVVTETIARARGVRAPRLRGISPVQNTAAWLLSGLTASLVATATLTTPAGSTAPTPATPPQTSSVSQPARQAIPESRAIEPVTAALDVDQASMACADDGSLTIDDTGYRYTVTRGQSLWAIAETCLGDGERWPSIWELNRGRYFPSVGGALTDPDLIYPGWDLALPGEVAPPATSDPSDPSESGGSGGSGDSDQAPESPSPSVTVSTPDSSATVSQEADGVVETTATTPPTAEPSTVASAEVVPAESGRPAQSDSRSARASGAGGVALPGGWVTLGLAASLAAAGALVWRRRRSRYDPAAEVDPGTDPTLHALPADLSRLRREVRRRAPGLLEPPDPGPTVREYVLMDPKPPPPPVGPTGPELAGLGPLPPEGLGLTGPGARAAARALLTATLSAGNLADPEAQAMAIVPSGVLADLIGGSAVVDLTGSIPRLAVTPGLPEALTLLDEHLLYRARILDTHEAPDLEALRLADPLAEIPPPILLIAAAPEPAARARLSTALHLGQPRGIGALLLGSWPRGTTLEVNADGTIPGEDDRRLSVLDEPTAADLLRVLRESHTGEPPAAPELAKPAEPTGPTQPPADPAPAEDADASSENESGETSRAGIPIPAEGVFPVGVRILGDRVVVLDPDGRPVPGLRGHAAQLLSYLAVHRSGADLADVKEAIWPDAPLKRANQRLATDVANLRATLRLGAGIQPATADGESQVDQTRPGKLAVPEFVLNPGGRYILKADLVDVDWWRVTDAVGHANHAADPGARVGALRHAVEAFSGPLFDHDGEYEWIEAEQEASRRYGVKALAQLAGLIGDEHPDQAAEYLARAAGLDPINERLARAAMRAHAANGDLEAIRTRFAILGRALEDIDQEPSPETSDLASALIARVSGTG